MDCQTTLNNAQLEFALRGRLAYSDTAAFADLLLRAKAGNFDFCIVDLTNLAYIDSSGLRMLLLLHDACKTVGAELEFRQAQGQVRDMLLHSRFDTIVKMAA